MSAEYLGCYAVPASVVGDRTGRNRARNRRGAAGDRRHCDHITINVGNLYQWHGERR